MQNKLCFLIPYYNHPNSIKKLIEKLLTYNMKIIIVDDASTPSLKEVINVDNNLITILNHKVNQGKGGAVITGIKWAYNNGYNSCLQIDADAQHDLDKISEFIEHYKNNPNSVICARPIYGDDAPKSRLYGRKITNFWVMVNTIGGLKEDSMVGMRIYPLSNINDILALVHSKRMAFDIDILISYYKNNYDFIWVDVAVSYDNNISHFRGFEDNVLISIMHARHFFAIPKLLLRKLLGKI